MLGSLVILLFFFVSNLKGAVTSSGYTYYPEARGYLKLHRAPEPWDSARIRCHDEGAVLASPLRAGLRGAIQRLQGAEPDALPLLFSGVHSIFSPYGRFTSIEGVLLKEMSIAWSRSLGDVSLEKLAQSLVFLADGSMRAESPDTALPYFCFAELSFCEPGGRKKRLPTGVTLGDYELDVRTGSGYKFHAQSANWTRAFEVCHDEGAHLAIINSDLEANVLSELFQKHPAETIIGTSFNSVAAVGFHSWKQTGSWWTIHGQTLQEAGYSRWGPGEPNTAEKFGGMYRDGTLDDLNGSFNVPFICEKTPMWWAGRDSGK